MANYICETLKHRNRDDINRWIKHACESNGVDYLASRISWKFNSRFTRRMGDAEYVTHKLRFSAPLWERAGRTEQKNTVIHEACHIIAYIRYGRQGTGHGSYWKSCMLLTGEKPTRTHKVNRDGLKRKVKRYPARCACKTYQLSGVRRNRMLRGAQYSCRKCKATLKLL